MESLRVALGERSYPIHIGTGLLDRADLYAPHLRGGVVAIVTNTVVAPLYLSRTKKALEAAGARAVGVSVVQRAEPERVLAELRTVRARLPASVPLLAGGAGAAALTPDLEGAGIHVVADLSALRAALRKQGTGWSIDGRR